MIVDPGRYESIPQVHGMVPEIPLEVAQPEFGETALEAEFILRVSGSGLRMHGS